MNAGAAATTVLVAGRHVIRISAHESTKRYSVDVVVTIDGVQCAPRTEPEWRDLRFGTAGDTFYWWSARRVTVHPLSTPSSPARVIDIDHDEILLVFLLADAWMIVCETSVLAVTADGAMSLFNLGEVILDARVEDEDVVFVDFNGKVWRLRFDGSTLSLVDSDGG